MQDRFKFRVWAKYDEKTDLHTNGLVFDIELGEQIQ